MLWTMKPQNTYVLCYAPYIGSNISCALCRDFNVQYISIGIRKVELGR